MSSTFRVLATIGLPPVSLVAAFYSTTKPQHLFPSTAIPATASSTISSTRADPDQYLAMTRQFDAKDFCSAMVSSRRRWSDIESHVESVFPTDARELLHLAPRPGRNLGHCAYWPSAFREVALPCRMDTYLFRRNCFTKAFRSVSILAGAKPSLRSLVDLKQA